MPTINPQSHIPVPGDPFITGVNYWPRRKAMHWWKQFDPAEVDEDFALISEMGLQVVRFFLFWEDFQPTPSEVSPAQLDNLHIVCDTAHRHGLKLDVTFFTGHMSATNWPPRWLLNGRPLAPEAWPNYVEGQQVFSDIHNPYVYPIALEAERTLLKAVVSRFKDHPAVWVWNLGNEPDIFAWPPSDTEGQRWAREMTQFIKSLDPVHPVTMGLHWGSLETNNGLRVDQIFAETDLAVMHSYPMYVPWLARESHDPDFVPFTCALTASLSGKPVLMEEFGGPTNTPGRPTEDWHWELGGRKFHQRMAGEEHFAQFLSATLPNLVEIGTTGAMLWSFADYPPELWGQPPCNLALHERFFGLVRPDGSLKPHAEVIRDFNRNRPTINPIPDWARLEVDPQRFYQNPRKHLPSLYQQYLGRKPR